MEAKRFAVVLLTVIAALLGRALPAAAADSFTPNPVAVTLAPGASTNISKTLHLDASPGKADVIIAVDTTSTMCGSLAQAQADAMQIVTTVKAQVPGARFAVVDFKDYPVVPYSTPPDYPYLLKTVTGFTADPATVQAAIATLLCSGGGDLPESYDRVFYEAYSDPLLTTTRDPTAPQFLVVLGDAPPHGDNITYGFPDCGFFSPVDPGRDMVPGTADDLPTDQVIAGLASHNITLLMEAFPDPTLDVLPCYRELVAPTGGLAVPGGSAATLAQRIVDASTAASTHITRVDLRVSAGCALGVTFSPAPPYGPLTAPVDINFTETITAPALPGSYTCTVTAVVDGVDRAVQTINATVVAAPSCRNDDGKDKGHRDDKGKKKKKDDGNGRRLAVHAGNGGGGDGQHGGNGDNNDDHQNGCKDDRRGD